MREQTVNKPVRFICRLLLVLLLISSYASVPMTITAQENITPIESVDWIDNGSDETDDEGAAPEEEIDTAEEVSSESESEIAASEEENTSEVAGDQHVDTTNPSSFLSDLSQLEQRIIEYVSFETEAGNMELISQNMLKDQDKVYAARLIPPYLPQALFLRVNNSQVEEAFMSVDDIIKYSADALNTQPVIYEGTVAEDFYVFSQENIDALQGTVVQMESSDNLIADETVYINLVEAFLTEVSIEWLAEQAVQDAVYETELGQQVDINGEIGQLFNELADSKEADYPELAEFFALYTEGYEGTITIDYENQLFGIGLLYNLDQEQLAGTELYIQASEAGIIDFGDEIIYSYDEFVELVGFDVISDIRELEASLTPDMFQAAPVE